MSCRQRMAMVVLPALALTLGVPSGSRADLVTNGGFEKATNFTGGKANFSTAGVKGWSGGGGLTFLDAPGTADDGSYLSVYSPFPKKSPDGGNFVEADADPNYRSAIYQTINGLTVGSTYAVSFYQAAGQQAGFTGSTTERWDVTFGATTQYSDQFSLNTGGVGQWQAQTLTFTATATSQLLSFLADGPVGGPPIVFLDGVSVAVVATPEPATIAHAGVGLLALGGAWLRRRFRAARA